MCQVTTTMWLLPKTFWRLTNIDIYICKISRWSYSILSKVFIWIQSSKKKWFENATFRHDWKLFSANWLLSEFWCTYSSQQALFLRPSENIHPFSVPRKSVGPDFVNILLFYRIWVSIPQKWPNGFSYIWSELSHWNTIIQ